MGCASCCGGKIKLSYKKKLEKIIEAFEPSTEPLGSERLRQMELFVKQKAKSLIEHLELMTSEMDATGRTIESKLEATDSQEARVLLLLILKELALTEFRFSSDDPPAKLFSIRADKYIFHIIR